MSYTRFYKILLSTLIGLAAFLFGIFINHLDPVIDVSKVLTINTVYECTDSNIEKTFVETVFGEVNFKSSLDPNSSIIISTMGDRINIDKDKFNKVNVAWSPIIAIFPYDITRDSANFSKDGNAYKIDMEKIIEAFIDSENGVVKARDIGLDSDNNIKLAIPSNSFSYRADVIKSLAYLITKGKDIDDSNMTEVNEKLNKLVKNAYEYKDIYELISSENEEFIGLTAEYVVASYNNYYIHPVYWTNAYTIPVDLYYRKDIDAEILDKLNSAINIMMNEKNIYSGARIRNNAKVKESGSNRLNDMAVVKPCYYQSDIDKVLGEYYSWG